jgi:hypothetical protein
MTWYIVPTDAKQKKPMLNFNSILFKLEWKLTTRISRIQHGQSFNNTVNSRLSGGGLTGLRLNRGFFLSLYVI